MPSVPAAAQTLAGEHIRLHDGSIAPASSPRLSSESGTLHIDQPTLAVLGAGHSTSASGVELHVGVAAVPEPSACWQLAAGALGLTGIARSRRRRKPIRAATSARAIFPL